MVQHGVYHFLNAVLAFSMEERRRNAFHRAKDPNFYPLPTLNILIAAPRSTRQEDKCI